MALNVYIIGFMGTGKSTVAKILADLLHRQFLEMDSVIEKEEGCSIVDIFAQKGEAYFRLREKELVKRLSRQENLIVSCGGGVILDPENRELMRKFGKVVCLQADSATILQRVKGSGDRPLLNVDNPLKKIESLLEERRKLYECAHFYVDTRDISPAQVALKIKEILAGAEMSRER